MRRLGAQGGLDLTFTVEKKDYVCAKGFVGRSVM